MNNTYEQSRESILKWSQKDIFTQLDISDCVEINRNNKDTLLIDLTFKNCLAQIVVSNPFFAPYHHVLFEALSFETKKSIENNEPEMIYFFYDSAEMQLKDVLEELSFGAKYCSKYLPDMLRELYLNKRGILIANGGNMIYSIHPNDIMKYDRTLIGGEFLCIDIQFQYLLIKNDFLSLRIIPKLFMVK